MLLFKELRIQDIRFQFENEKNSLIAEIKEFQQKCITYENKISFYTIEIERLNGIILEKQGEIEEGKVKLNDFNVQFRNLKELHLVSVSSLVRIWALLEFFSTLM